MEARTDRTRGKAVKKRKTKVVDDPEVVSDSSSEGEEWESCPESESSSVDSQLVGSVSWCG